MRRLLVGLGLGVVLLVGSAAPAAAHSVSGAGATNYQTVLDDVSPEVDGITVEVIENGSRIELTNTTDTEVVVLGYEEEPYLRIGPDGVFENQNSPATYLNQDRNGTATPVPESADPDAEPDWKHLSDSDTARWHDHRIHRMGRQDPPAVRADPGATHEVQAWTIAIQHGDQTIEATGRLLWIPGPSALPWWLGAAVLAGLVIVAGALGRSPLLAIALGLLIAVDVVHTIGIVGSAADDKLAVLLPGSVYSIVAWVVGGAAVPLVWRDRREGLLAAVFAAVLILIFGGLVDRDTLSRSQVPFLWSDDFARVCVSATIGLGVGVAAGALTRLWRSGAFRAAPARPSAPIPSEP